MLSETAIPKASSLANALDFAERLQHECHRTEQLLQITLWLAVTLLLTSLAMFTGTFRRHPLFTTDSTTFALMTLLLCVFYGLIILSYRLWRLLRRRRAVLFELVQTLHEAASAVDSSSSLERSVFQMRLASLDISARRW